MTSPSLPVPEAFSRRIVEVHEASGIEWLHRLPDRIAELARDWQLRIGSPVGELSYNYVIFALRADGSEAVLKAGVPNRELLTEMAVLRLFNGRGAVRLLQADASRGALLLERLRPGTPLRHGSVQQEEGDQHAAVIASQLMQRLWRPVPPEHPFPTFTDLITGMAERAPEVLATEPSFPTAWLDRAVALSKQVSASAFESVILHGDLHRDNILSAEREPWLAIDAWGLVGEPACEPGPFLLNAAWEELDDEAASALLGRLVEIFAKQLNLPANRIRDWGIVRAVLSGFWSLEDHGHGWEPALRCARLLAHQESGR